MDNVFDGNEELYLLVCVSRVDDFWFLILSWFNGFSNKNGFYQSNKKKTIAHDPIIPISINKFFTFHRFTGSCWGKKWVSDSIQYQKKTLMNSNSMWNQQKLMRNEAMGLKIERLRIRKKNSEIEEWNCEVPTKELSK